MYIISLGMGNLLMAGKRQWNDLTEKNEMATEGTRESILNGFIHIQWHYHFNNPRRSDLIMIYV